MSKVMPALPAWPYGMATARYAAVTRHNVMMVYLQRDTVIKLLAADEEDFEAATVGQCRFTLSNPR